MYCGGYYIEPGNAHMNKLHQDNPRFYREAEPDKTCLGYQYGHPCQALNQEKYPKGVIGELLQRGILGNMIIGILYKKIIKDHLRGIEDILNAYSEIFIGLIVSCKGIDKPDKKIYKNNNHKTVVVTFPHIHVGLKKLIANKKTCYDKGYNGKKVYPVHETRRGKHIVIFCHFLMMPQNKPIPETAGKNISKKVKKKTSESSYIDKKRPLIDYIIYMGYHRQFLIGTL